MQYQLPYCSIIIPTYNRPQPLAACLAALERLDYPRDRFEVIIVDDGSNISLEAAFVSREILNLMLITQTNSGPATARNAGAQVARGTVLAFTDDDCQPAADWLKTLVHYIVNQTSDNTMSCAVGGQTFNALPQNCYSTASQALVEYFYSQTNAVPADAGFFTSNNLALSTADFQAIGGFDETFPLAAAEDREFCHRWRDKGHRLIYAPNAIVYHAHDLTFKSFCQQQFNYGRGAFHFYQRQAEQKRQQPQRLAWIFYLKLLCYPFRQVDLPAILPVAYLFFISQVAVTIGWLTEASSYWPSQAKQPSHSNSV